MEALAIRPIDTPALLPEKPIWPAKVEVIHPNTLEDFLSDIGGPDAPIDVVQAKVDDYVKYNEFANEDIFKNGTKFVPIKPILEKKRGDCTAGFSLMSAILHKKGYKPYGIAIHPTDPANKPGHIICAYQDSITKEYHTAGKSHGDRIRNFKTLEDIAAVFAARHNYNLANAYVLEPTKEQLEALTYGDELVEIPRKELCKVNTAERFHFRVDTYSNKHGQITVECAGAGTNVDWAGG